MAIDPAERRPTGLLLFIYLTPGASHNKLDRIQPPGEDRARLRATVTAPAEKGKANTALIKMIAKKLRLPKSSIQIIAGLQSRRKTLSIDGDPKDLLRRVSALFDAEGLTAR